MDQHEPRDAAVELAHAIFQACRDGDTDTVVTVVDQGAPVNMQDAEGNTMVMLAAYHGNADLVRVLGERGADVNLTNDRGQTPLAGAVFKGYDDVSRVLLEAGADPDLGTPTARDAAVMFNRDLDFGSNTGTSDPSQ